MKYDTINDGEATPLQIPDDGDSVEDGTSVAPSSTKNKRTSSIIVRTLLVGTAVGALLLLAGPSKMMTTMNKSRNVDGMVVASKIGHCTLADVEEEPCYVPSVGVAFSGLSCKDSDGFCARGGESFGAHPAMDHYETCYVSQNGYCWSRSHTHRQRYEGYHGTTLYYACYDRCDPVGYFDHENGYDDDGVWHVSAPKSDGSCGDPCQEIYGDDNGSGSI